MTRDRPHDRHQLSSDRDNTAHSCDPITAIEIDHACQLELCNILEAIADDLPEIADRDRATVAMDVLRRGMAGHARLEDELLFPLLRQRCDAAPELLGFIAQLEQEHANDQEFAHEIAEALDDLVQSGRASNGEMLGYMLRGYFTAQRRHIEWENATIIPLARRILQAGDLVALAISVDAHAGASAAREVIRSLADKVRDLKCSGTCPDCTKRGSSGNNGSGYA